MNEKDGANPAPGAPVTFPSVMTTRWALLLMVVFAASAYVIYQAGFTSPMIYDSRSYIEAKQHVFADGSLMDILGLVPARPLFILAVFLNYSLTGMDTYFLRLFIVIGLAAMGLMFALMVSLILNNQAVTHGGDPKKNSVIAFFLSFLFVVHPAQSFAVLYIWQASTIMSCFFYFSCVCAYLGVRTGLIAAPRIGYALVGICFFLGLASKEIAITVPVILVIAEITVLKSNFRELMRRIVIIGIITLPAFIAYFLVASNLGVENSIHASSVWERLHQHYEESGVGLVDRLLTLPNLLVSYLLVILAPAPDRLPLLQPQWIVQSPWSPPQTIPSYIVVIASMGLCVTLARKRPVFSFGLALWMVSLIPECLLSNYLFFAQRAILPMAGLLLALGDVLWIVLKKVEYSKSKSLLSGVTAGGLISCLIMAAIGSYNQAARWDPVQVWEDIYKSSPKYTKGIESLPYLDIISNYSATLIRRGEYSKAAETLQPLVECISVDSGEAASRVDPISNELCAITMRKNFQAQILINMAAALNRSGRNHEAIEIGKRATSIDPDNAAGWNNLASALRESGEIRDSVAYYRRAHELDPHDSSIIFNFASTLLMAGDFSEAVEHYEKIRPYHGNFLAARINMSAALLKMGEFARAVDTIERTLLIVGDNADLYNLLGVVYIRQNRPAKALRSFEKALETKPDHNMAGRNLRALKQDMQSGRR